MSKADPGARPMDFSIIVPAWDAERWVGACIEGLLSQSYPRHMYEILVVDNGSTDRTRSVAERYDGVIVLSEEACGSYAARNRALRTARGSVVAFTDADCVPEPDWLAGFAEAMRDPLTQVAIGRNLAAKPTRALTLLGKYAHQKDTFIFSGSVPDLYYGRTNNMAVRRDSFDRTGPFENRARGSDTMLVRRVVEGCGCSSVRYHPSAQVLHLELQSARILFNKYYIYGLHSHDYRDPGGRGPTFGESWQVFRRTRRYEHLSLLSAAFLLLLLGFGSVCWLAGRWSSRVARRRRAR